MILMFHVKVATSVYFVHPRNSLCYNGKAPQLTVY